MTRLLTRRQAAYVLMSLSTNISQLSHRPVVVLIGSVLVPSTPEFSLDGLLTVGIGIGLCLSVIEHRRGTLTAVAVFAAGHVGATLLTAAVIIMAVAAHRYPHEVYHAFDFGVSYGSVTATSATLWLLPRWLGAACLAVGIGYLLSLANWYGVLPDFTTVGHLWALAIGLTFGAFLWRDKTTQDRTDADRCMEFATKSAR